MLTTNRPTHRTTNIADLHAEAKSLGVEIDQRWGPERLRREIDAAKAKTMESETPDPDGSLDSDGTLVNVGSTAAPVYERRKD